jgi:hypothetical protein
MVRDLLGRYRHPEVFRKGLGSIASAIALTASIGSAADAGDIHRVITTLDPSNKSTTLFDSNVPLEIGKSGYPGAILWITDTSPAGFSQDDTGKRPIGISPPNNGTVCCVWSNFLRPMRPNSRAWIPIS